MPRCSRAWRLPPSHCSASKLSPSRVGEEGPSLRSQLPHCRPLGRWQRQQFRQPPQTAAVALLERWASRRNQLGHAGMHTSCASEPFCPAALLLPCSPYEPAYLAPRTARRTFRRECTAGSGCTYTIERQAGVGELQAGSPLRPRSGEHRPLGASCPTSFPELANRPTGLLWPTGSLLAHKLQLMGMPSTISNGHSR